MSTVKEQKKATEAQARNDTSAPPPKLVGALVSGLRVLRYLSSAQQPVGVTQIARTLNITPSTCFQILKTLVHEGLVVFQPDRKTYRIGLGVLRLAYGALERVSCVRMVHPALHQIAAEHNVLAMLWHRQGDRVILVHRVEPPQAISLFMNVGQRLPSLMGAMGRCVAAFTGMPEDEVAAAFAELRWQDPPPLADFLKDMERARRDGFAVDHGNFIKGVTSVAAPILDGAGDVVMLINAAGLSAQLDADHVAALAATVRRHAQEITAALRGGD